MSLFEHYAEYYDALYQDKNHEAECDFLEEIFDRYAQGSIRIIFDQGAALAATLLESKGCIADTS